MCCCGGEDLRKNSVGQMYVVLVKSQVVLYFFNVSEGIFVSEHRWTILPGGLGVEQRCHPLPLIRISENGR